MAGEQPPSVFDDPEGYMRNFEQRMAAMRGKADQVNQMMADISVRAESDEREVAVTVNVGGALASLEIGPTARHLSGPALAALIMETYQRAAIEASHKSVEVMSELLGESEATRFIRQTVNRYAPREE